MKRAFPQRAKSAISSAVGNDELTGQSKSASEVNRRACTSAAAIGLAISMGASSLLMPQQNDGAIASEPVTTEPSIAAVPSSLEASVVPYRSAVESPTPAILAPESSTESPAVVHTVQEGQTLWKLSQIYQVEAAEIATSNGIKPSTPLQVGQVLRIPTDRKAIPAIQTAPRDGDGALLPSNQSSSNQLSSVQSAEVSPSHQATQPGPGHSKNSRMALNPDGHTEISAAATKDLPSTNQQVALGSPSQAFLPKATEATPSVIQFGAPLPPGQTLAARPEEAQLASTKQANPVNVIQFGAPIPSGTQTAPLASAPLEQTKVANPNPEGVIPYPALPVPSSGATLSASSPSAVAPKQETGEPKTAIANPVPVTRIEVAAVAQPTSIIQRESPALAAPLPVTPVAYKVKPGDTLAVIARAHGMSVEEVAKANRISDPNYIFVNQVLKIRPSQSERPVAASVQVPTPMAVSSVDLTNSVRVNAPLSIGGSESQVGMPMVQPATSVALNPTAVRNQPVVLSTASAAVVAQPTINSLTPGSGVVVPEQGPVAVAPLSDAPFHPVTSVQPAPFNVEPQYSPYAENLRVEIIRLREKFSSQEASVSNHSSNPVLRETTTLSNRGAIATNGTAQGRPSLPAFGTAPASTPAVRLNPEFSPSRQAQELQAAVQNRLESAPNPGVAAQPKLSARQETVVATAPAGSESYAPLMQPLIGQMVSPNLPPLGKSDRYLPGGSTQFAGYIWPAQGELTSGFGWRWGRMHSGIDIAAPIGTPIVAAAPGVVVTAGWNSGGYGNMVEIQHPDGSLTLYAHSSRLLVQEGQQVAQGELIAEIGSTGYSTGPHLHLEIHLPGQGAVNPIAMLPSN